MQRDSVLRVIAISDLRRVGQELTCGSAKLTGGQRTRELLHFRSTFYSIRNKLRGGGAASRFSGRQGWSILGNHPLEFQIRGRRSVLTVLPTCLVQQSSFLLGQWLHKDLMLFPMHILVGWLPSTLVIRSSVSRVSRVFPLGRPLTPTGLGSKEMGPISTAEWRIATCPCGVECPQGSTTPNGYSYRHGAIYGFPPKQ